MEKGGRRRNVLRFLPGKEGFKIRANQGEEGGKRKDGAGPSDRGEGEGQNSIFCGKEEKETRRTMPAFHQFRRKGNPGSSS